MKTKILKTLCISLSLIMTLGMLGITVLADDPVYYTEDFDSQSMDASVISNNSSYSVGYADALGGKDAGDYAVYEEINDSIAGTFQVKKFADWFTTNYGTYTYEMSILYNGADYAQISMYAGCHPSSNSLRLETIQIARINADGSVSVGGNDTGIKCYPNEWLRVALELTCTGTNNATVYINGHSFTIAKTYDNVRVLRWMQVQSGWNSAGEGSNTGLIAVDDVKIYEGNYQSTGGETISYTVSPSNGVTLDSSLMMLMAPETATVSQVLDSIVTENDKIMVDSTDSFTEISSGTIADGNTVVLRSSDGIVYEYLTVITSEPEVPAEAIAYESDFNTSELQVAGSSTIQLGNSHSYPIDYPSALGGRASNDYSMRETFPGSVTSSGFQFMQYAGYDSTNGKFERYTYEFSMLYGGDADFAKFQVNTRPNSGSNTIIVDLNIQDGVVKFNGNDTGIRCNKDEWLRVALDLDCAGYNSSIYLNGQKFDFSYNKVRFVNWIQLTAGFITTDSSKSATIAIDDIKIYKGSYYNSPKGLISYSVSGSGFDYIPAGSLIACDTSTQISSILSAITSGNTFAVHTSHNNPAVIASGTASDGNVVVFKSENGKAFDYITLSTSAASRVIRENNMPSGSLFSIYGDSGYVTRTTQTGLFTKALSDTSYALVASNIPAGTSYEYRTEIMPAISSAAFTADSFTTEFSVAYDGDVTNVSFVNYSSSNTAERFSYDAPVSFLNGKIYVNDNGTSRYIRNCREKEWYRIGVTYYPAELKQDIYVNGVKYVTKGWITNDTAQRDPSLYSLTGFYWYQLNASFNGETDKVRSGNVYIDDTVVYYGEHAALSGYATEFDSLTYAIGSLCNDLYLDEDNIDVSDFAENIDFNEDYPPAIYTNNSYSTDAESITYGSVIVVTSPNGLVKEYYKVLPSDPSIDSTISCFVNGAAGTAFAAKEEGEDDYSSIIKATASAYAPAYTTGLNGCLVLAVYKDGVLEDVVIDSQEIKSETSYKVSYTLTETSGVSAKAMFVDSLMNLKPYAPARAFTEAAAE